MHGQSPSKIIIVFALKGLLLFAKLGIVLHLHTIARSLYNEVLRVPLAFYWGLIGFCIRSLFLIVSYFILYIHWLYYAYLDISYIIFDKKIVLFWHPVYFSLASPLLWVLQCLASVVHTDTWVPTVGIYRSSPLNISQLFQINLKAHSWVHEEEVEPFSSTFQVEVEFAILKYGSLLYFTKSWLGKTKESPHACACLALPGKGHKWSAENRPARLAYACLSFCSLFFCLTFKLTNWKT